MYHANIAFQVNSLMFESIQIEELTFAMDMLAAVTFAVTGALVASRKGLDILGFMWFSVITGVGGGTVRDLILDAPVFWLVHTEHIIACLITAVCMFFFAPLVESRFKLVLWFDALGLAFVTVVGVVKAIEYDVPLLVAVVMGVITGSVGGIIRDVIGGVHSVILLKEIYVMASVIGASLLVVLHSFDVDTLISSMIAFFIIFLIRALAISFNWSMPGPIDKSNNSSEEQ